MAKTAPFILESGDQDDLKNAIDLLNQAWHEIEHAKRRVESAKANCEDPATRDRLDEAIAEINSGEIGDAETNLSNILDNVQEPVDDGDNEEEADN